MQLRKKKALTLAKKGRWDEARRLYLEIIAKDPGDAQAFFTLGVIAYQQQDPRQAVSYLQHARALRPDHLKTLYNLGVALNDSRQVGQAMEAFEAAVALDGRHVESLRMLAQLYLSSGHFDRAIPVYERLLKLAPGDTATFSRLGAVLMHLGYLGRAEKYLRQAIACDPADLASRDNLGACYSDQGKYREAVEFYRETIAKYPFNSQTYSNYLLSLEYDPRVARSEMFNEHLKWGELIGNKQPAAAVETLGPVAGRKIRVGYVSADFRTHSVSYFFEPLLENQDKDRFETFCFYSAPRGDATTERLKQHADHWREVAGLDDARFTARVRRDKLDILVDLAGHTAKNRLPALAGRLAPIQITWLGYPDTTGLSAMDYRITDAVADPEGEEAYYTETLLRVPDCFLCYRGRVDSPPPGQAPVMERGYISYGCFNNLAKVNEQMIEAWCRILRQDDTSRFVFKNPALSDPASRDRYLELFSSYGIGEERLELIGRIDDINEHLAMYHKVDIALDTFPYNGTTTTCEALWMGVPTVTLAGDRHAARVGASLLNAAGLGHLVAASVDDYIETAARLAADRPALMALRRGLRERLLHSRLCDAAGYARKMEHLYQVVISESGLGRQLGGIDPDLTQIGE